MLGLNLKTEYLYNPLGIDFTRPRLFWNCEGDITQTAYQIVCRNDNGDILWDSGKTAGSIMRTQYEGKPIGSRNRIYWRVRLWNENDQPGEWSEEALFELGLLAADDWQAKWITGNYRVNKKQRYPADCFLKKIQISDAIQKARLYITACGLYEARLDDKKIGSFCLAPGHTDYNRRIHYQTYDVTELLSKGSHDLTIQLADGWYRGSCGAWGIRNQYGTETKCLAQLEITYTNGKRVIIGTDKSWNWSNDGPVRFADNKDGEIVEAFRTPSYGGSAKETAHSVAPTASNSVQVTEHERLQAAVSNAPNGKLLFDFKQNMAGWLEFKTDAKKGQRIIIRCGEMLDEQGNLTLKNIQLRRKDFATPLQKVEYICKDGENQYKTAFAVFGFRYAEVETDVELEAENLTAIAVYSDIKQTGYFESSNPLLNKLVEMTAWSTKSNSLDVPTDCPTRERHGWTGDAQIFFETASYLFDYAAFSEKYLKDVYDWQRKDGCLPQIAPYGGVDFYMNTLNGSVGWADAGILIPYRFWKHYGDRQILTEYYDRMKKYAAFMICRCGKLGLLAKPLGLKGEAKKYAVNAGQSYGEWAEPADVHPNKWTDMVAPHPEESTAYTAYVLGILSEISAELGETRDEVYFRKYSEGCKKAYQALSEKPSFTLDTDRQARLVRPLAFGLLNEKQTEFAKKRLVKALENYGWRLGTGFLSTPLIMDVLSGYDLNAAYRLLENEEMPGWLFMPKNGATTIWESWEGTLAQGDIASLNHYSKGAVCEWLFKTMCGIRIDGENHFIIAPKPGGNFSFVKAAYDSVFGRVESGWRREREITVYDIVIPANCTAEITLPNGEPTNVYSGNYHFEIR